MRKRLFGLIVSPYEEVTSAVAGAASHTAYSIKKQRATSERLFVLSSLSPFTMIQDPRPRKGVTQGIGLSISINQIQIIPSRYAQNPSTYRTLDLIKFTEEMNHHNDRH